MDHCFYGVMQKTRREGDEMIRGGFAGRVLRVDLTRGVVETEPLDDALATDFIGGLGLTAKLAYEAIEPGTDPLSPENPIALGAGPLVGTNLPSSSRVFAVTKLPTSHSIGWCGGGGASFGYLLKNAGYDHVVIEGRADRPVRLEITDEGAELRDASDLWGLGVDETCEALWREYGRPLGVICIGQAGEHRVRFSMAFIDRISTLGRGGLGAVMGAKNLKAITARGARGIEVADRKRYRRSSRSFLQTIREYPYLKESQDLGLVKSFPIISRETYQGMKKRRISCVSCPVGCKDLIEIPDGALRGLREAHQLGRQSLHAGSLRLRGLSRVDQVHGHHRLIRPGHVRVLRGDELREDPVRSRDHLRGLSTRRSPSTLSSRWRPGPGRSATGRGWVTSWPMDSRES